LQRNTAGRKTLPQITENFTVEQPVEVVWTFFQDVPEIAACMPGVELLSAVKENTFQGKMQVKLGPISANFQGEAQIEDLVERDRTGTISAKGIDRRGGSRASAKVRYRLTNAGSGTQVDILADIALQGPMAQFGRTGLIQDISSRLTREFADCIGEKLAAETPEEAAGVKAGDVKGFKLIAHALRAWFRRLFRRGTGKST
jgi:carbon-monoxide dehydrogenase small subunit